MILRSDLHVQGKGLFLPPVHFCWSMSYISDVKYNAPVIIHNTVCLLIKIISSLPLGNKPLGEMSVRK